MKPKFKAGDIAIFRDSDGKYGWKKGEVIRIQELCTNKIAALQYYRCLVLEDSKYWHVYPIDLDEILQLEPIYNSSVMKAIRGEV